MPKKYIWNAQGTEKPSYVGDTDHGFAASGTVGANDREHAEAQVIETLCQRGCTVQYLAVSPLDRD